MDNEKESKLGSGSEPQFGLLLVMYLLLFFNTTKVRDKADQRGVYASSGGC